MFVTPVSSWEGGDEWPYNLYFYFRSIYERSLFYQYLVREFNNEFNIYLDNPSIEYGESPRRKKGRRKYGSNELVGVALDYLYNDSDYALGIYVSRKDLILKTTFFEKLKYWALENNYICYHKSMFSNLSDIQLIKVEDFYEPRKK